MRVLNVASHLMIEGAEPAQRQRLARELNGGRMRTMGKPLTADEMNAPAWWQGEDEAFESVDIMLQSLPQRGRARE